MNNTILVAEDEVKISELICKYLSVEGYNSLQANNGSEAISLFEEFKPDLIILDIMLPDIDGIAVCEKIRATSNTPIIMLTARTDEVDRLIGFAKGADDYVCKPFNPRELMARVKAIIRRSDPSPLKNILSQGPITLIINEHSTKINNKEIQLTQIEFNLLSTMMEKPSQVFSREELLTASQGTYSESYERTIDFHIKNLRKKINIDGKYNYIKTVYGIGYKLINNPE